MTELKARKLEGSRLDPLYVLCPTCKGNRSWEFQPPDVFAEPIRGDCTTCDKTGMVLTEDGQRIAGVFQQEFGRKIRDLEVAVKRLEEHEHPQLVKFGDALQELSRPQKRWWQR